MILSSCVRHLVRLWCDRGSVCVRFASVPPFHSISLGLVVGWGWSGKRFGDREITHIAVVRFGVNGCLRVIWGF